MEVRFALKNGEPDLSTAHVRTLAQARAEEAAAMFDTLVQAGRHLDPRGDRSKLHPEQFAAFTLLLLANRAHIDVDVSLQADNEPCAVCPPLERYQLAGFVSTRAKVQTGLSAPLGGIMFDLASLGYTE